MSDTIGLTTKRDIKSAPLVLAYQTGRCTANEHLANTG